MGEDPNGRLPGDADEQREPLPQEEPVSAQLREAASNVAQFLQIVEDCAFNADDKMSRDFFRMSLARLEKTVIQANRVYTAEMRRYHKRRGEAMGLPL